MNDLIVKQIGNDVYINGRLLTDQNIKSTKQTSLLILAAALIGFAIGAFTAALLLGYIQ